MEESKKTKKNCVREERRRVCEGEENLYGRNKINMRRKYVYGGKRKTCLTTFREFRNQNCLGHAGFKQTSYQTTGLCAAGEATAATDFTS